MLQSLARIAAALVLVGLIAAPALAADGRIEINQSSVDAAGGFPFVITEPGSYVLTSDLVVATDVTAISIAFGVSSGVNIDLNGFRIVGPTPCTFGNCAEGSASAIQATLFMANHSVRNGDISGFSGTCVDLPAAAHVENLRVTSCGGNGITVNAGGVATGNRVASVGRHGLALGTGTVFAHNTVSLTGLGGGSEPAVSGGRATAGNFCDDGSCTANPRPRYYLSGTVHDGSEASEACDPGFHMASLWEIFDTSNLDYDTTRGQTFADSGQGPVAATQRGWIRTGNIGAGAHPSDPGFEIGFVNCKAWTSNLPSDNGTRAGLGSHWTTSSVQEVAPWSGSAVSCSVRRFVWCVQD